MQKIFELIGSVGDLVDKMKVAVKKVCRNIIITMATAISVLTVIIVSVIINGENKTIAEVTTEKIVNNDVISEDTTEEVTETVVENVTEEITNSTSALLSGVKIEEETTEEVVVADVEVNNIGTSTLAPAQIYYTQEDYETLVRIVHCEAGNQDDKGKILVANVIINRVKSEKFPDSIYEVVTQNDGKTYQFSPVIPGGSFYSITPSEHTRECVDRALTGEDYSQGALFFCCETSPNSWFNTKLTFLFTHGPHYFYK